MPADQLFKMLERRTEQDLYRMTFRLAATTKNELVAQLEANRKALLRRQIALEVIWFFASLIIGFVLGYIFNETVIQAFPDFYKTLLGLFDNKPLNILYLLIGLCFVGVYITRLTIWALKKL